MDILRVGEKYKCSKCLSEVPDKVDCTCPNCGTKLNGHWRGNVTRATFLAHYNIVDNGDKIQLLADYITRTVVETNEGPEVFSTRHNCCWIINTKTGLSYALPVRNDRTKRNVRAKHNGLMNVTYTHSFHYSARYAHLNGSSAMEMCDELAKLLIQKHNIVMDREFCNRRWDLQELFWINRYPRSLTTKEYWRSIRDLITYAHTGKEPLLLRRYWDKKSPRELAKIFKFPCVPSVLKRISCNPEGVYRFSAFSSLKLDNAIKLYDALESFGKSWSRHKYEDYYVSFINLFDDETVGTNRLVKYINSLAQNNDRFYYTTYILEDSIRMITRAQHIDSIDIKPLLKEKSLDVLHDKLVAITKNIGRIDIPFKNEKEMSKEGQVGDLIFSIPTSSNELVVIGNTMDICVGSYDDRVLTGATKIAYAHRDNKLVACIEYDKSLKQVKGPRNRLLEEDDQKKVLSWAKHCHINAGDIYDITTSLKKELPFHPLHQPVEGIRNFEGLSQVSGWGVPF